MEKTADEAAGNIFLTYESFVWGTSLQFAGPFNK